MNKAYSDIVRSLNLYQVWLYQAYYNLSAKYKRTVFGSLWIAASYLSFTLAVSLVWGALFGRDLAEVMPHIMVGFLVVMFVLSILFEAPEAFLVNSGVIRNHAYPANYFVLEGEARAFMTLLHNLPIAYIAMTILGVVKVPNWTIILGLPVVLLTVWLWGMVIAMASARFRDLRFLLPQIGHMLLLLTPIYWEREMLRDKVWIADYNPVAALVELVRQPILGNAPSSIQWGVAIAFCLTGLAAYAIFFPLFRRRIPFWV